MTPEQGDTLVAISEEDRERAAAAQARLRPYIEMVWPILEPGTPFVAGYHIDAICDHLEATYRRQIRNLLITMPPRLTKSFTATISFPTWVWTQDPSERFLTASYAAALSTEHAVLSRRVLESWWYQEHFGDRVRLTTDQNVKTHYENTARGYRIATSVGGAVVGRGGDFLILDDPHNLEERHSVERRKSVIDWHQKVWYSRLNDPKRGCRVVIMQRCHQGDLAGALIEAGNYEHLCLPNEYNPKKTVSTSLGWKDPRTTTGELLCEERFGPAETAGARKSLGSEYHAQYQQDPLPESGHLFKREWFQTVDAVPAGALRGRGWDGAGTEDDGDYTVGVKMAVLNGRYYIEHVVRGQWGPGKADDIMLQTVKADGTACRQREEQEPGSAGKKVIAAHLKLFAGHDYKGEPSSGDKVTRARPFRAQCEGGNVFLVAGPWNQEYLDELCAFPKGDHDDQVDASSTIFNELALHGKGGSVGSTTGW